MTSGQLIDYVYKMCLYGEPEFILTYQVTKVSGGYEYNYCEEGLKPLWTEEEPLMTTVTLGQLLSAFSGMANSCKEYLLDFDHIGLDASDFKLRHDGTVGFSYRPFIHSNVEQLRQRLERWLALVHQHIDDNSEEAMTIMHSLGIAIASESLEIQSFAEVVENSLGNTYV